jgi:hypothetical protein
MINLPKKVGARGHDCVVASVTMVCMYWRQAKQSLPWNLPLDFDHEEWNNFYEKGRTYVRRSGMPFNNIKLYLRKLGLPVNAKQELLEDAYGLRNLIRANIPPIVLYDRNYFFKHEYGIGHAVVLVDQTEEMFISIDPSFGPKYVHKLPKTDFEEAWRLKGNATIIIYPKRYNIKGRKTPSTTLMNFVQKGGRAV